MNTMNIQPARTAFPAVRYLGAALIAALFATAAPATEANPETGVDRNYQDVLGTYRRVLPLEGGSNFRDMGGYPAAEGKRVKRGLLFRSAVMTALTPEDRQYLDRFEFETVVDLRSREERQLYPNRWARAEDIDYVVHDYSFADLMADSGKPQATPDMETVYGGIVDWIEPQLKLYFEALLARQTPLVVNCSAGQDRTGVASSLLLTALGVPREIVIEDYLLSTDFRRPAVERSGVNLEAAAEDNAFAKMMMNHRGEESTRAKPLVTDEGVPLLQLVFNQMESEYGSVLAYLDQELGVDDADIRRLRQYYLQ